MALTSSDETDLLLPLYKGVYEEPLFATFLQRLQKRTEAEQVALVLRKVNAPAASGKTFFAGIDLSARARELGIFELLTLEGVHRDDFRPGRVYSVSEFVDHDPEYRERRQKSIERLGIRDERVVRLPPVAGFDAWLMMVRSRPCSAADSALLSNLAPYIATVLESLVMAERQSLANALSSEGLCRAGAGWILLDPDLKVIEIDPETDRALRKHAGIHAVPDQRLRGIDAAASRALAEAAEKLLSEPDALPRSVVLSNEPRVEALLQRANNQDETLLDEPALMAICRLPRATSPGRAQRLASAYDLPPREAELAIALSDGKSIAEAAVEMGLTIETARNYSKRLYASLGVRGQAELVRAVYESSAVLA